MVKLARPPSTLRPAPPALRAPPKIADPFYVSRDWRALVARLRRERGARCEHPDHVGDRRCERIIGDHVVERRDGGADLDAGNIMLVCPACHARKTAASAAARAASPV